VKIYVIMHITAVNAEIGGRAADEEDPVELDLNKYNINK